MLPAVHLVEVSPRDGLQNEDKQVATEVKVELALRAAAAGLRRIELTSFVNPKAVPQMADAEAVVRGVRERLPDPDGELSAVELSAVALNARGVDRAIAAGMDAVTFVMLATEEFNLRNQGCSRADSMRTWLETAARCRDEGMRTTFMLGASCGCPFTGEVAAATVHEVIEQALVGEPDEIALADTIGCGVPPQITELFTGVRKLTDVPMRVHLHNTRNAGYANAFAAIAAGVTALDASLGGIGGCPFAPAATGNIATEDLAWMLGRAAIDDSVSVEQAIAASALLAEHGIELDALLGPAGSFPAPVSS